MKKDAIYALVRRLAGGRKNPGELDQIFLWLRMRTLGNRVIGDVGDFVAHSDERDAGSTWSSVRDAVAGFAFAIKDRIPISRQQLVAFLEGAMRLENPALVKRELRIPQRAAHKTLKQVIPKITRLEGNVLYTDGDLTDHENAVLSFYIKTHYANYAFTRSQLIDQFVDCLRGNGLLNIEREAGIRLQSDFIALSVAVKMHKCEMVYEDGTKVVLEIDPNLSEYMVVAARCKFPADQGHFAIIYTVFNTECTVASHSRWHKEYDGYWEMPLEIDEEGKVIPLTL